MTAAESQAFSTNNSLTWASSYPRTVTAFSSMGSGVDTTIPTPCVDGSDMIGIQYYDGILVKSVLFVSR